MISRNPQGHFISREAMLRAWLPRMLDWMHGDAIPQVLVILADWCSARMAERFTLLAKWLTDSPNDMSNVDWTNKQVAQWRERRRILLDAVERLKAVK